MADDHDKNKGWHPTVVAALIGAAATIATTLVVTLVPREDAPQTSDRLRAVAEEPREPSQTVEKPSAVNTPLAETRTDARKSPDVTQLRGSYTAQTPAGTVHLSISNRGTYQMSVPRARDAKSRAIEGTVSTSGGYIVLESEGTKRLYSLGADFD
jgi:hypothetical protein